MGEWILRNIRYLSEGSYNSVNKGQTSILPKYSKTYLNIETGELNEVTDLQSKIYKRDKFLRLFFNVYLKYYSNKQITILSAIVNQDTYPTITKFINTITRKLKRKGINRLGYFWVRDVGEKRFHKHFHILIATSRITAEKFKDIFEKKDHNKYDVQFLKSKGMKRYINDKELYAANKQRAFGKSKTFPLNLKNSNLIKNHPKTF
jgi:hypothetical protein